MITTALLDVDGTLLDSLGIWHRIDIEFFADRGMALPADYVQRIEHMSFAEAAAFTVRTYDFECTPHQLQAEWYERARHAYSQVHLKSHVREFLQTVHEAQLQRVVVTGLSRELYDAVCTATGLKQYVDQAYVLEDYGEVGKGDTQVFQTVLTRINQSADSCLLFEDTLEGIRTAHELGITTCAVLDPQTRPQWDELRATADYAISSFIEAQHIIKSLRSA